MKYTFMLMLCFSFFSLTQAQQHTIQAADTQPGTLDQSYGNEGKVIDQSLRATMVSSALQPDGKIVMAGYNNEFVIVRYNTDGSLDSGFGSKGVIINYFDNAGAGFNGWSGVQVQPDGKIVVAGYLLKHDGNNYPYYDGDMVLARFNPDGAPDASFGNNGVVITDFGEYETVQAIALQPDGKIVTTGIYSLRGLGYDSNILTVRYNPNGSLDKSFGGKGYVIYAPPGTGADNAYALTMQPDGKIIIAGNWFATDWCVLLRYLPNGDLDESFGANGRVSTQIGIDDNGSGEQAFYAVTTDKQQHIIAAGISGDNLMAVARYNQDGTPDKSFDEDGQKIITFNEDDYYDEAKALLLLKDGRILLAGDAVGDFALACLQPNGAYDSTFGINGKATTNFGIGGAFGYHALLQADSKIVLTGGSYDGLDGYYMLVRYNGYDPNKQPIAMRIKRWLQHHGISWQYNPTIRYYSVQRSTDGITYKEVASVSSNSSTYEDATPNAGNYYRLIAAAKDGSRVYSNTVLVDEVQSARIFPNPVKDNLQLQGLPPTGKTSLSVMDLNGTVRSSATATGTISSVSTANLSSGSYLLQIQHGGTTVTQPFVKE